MKRFVTTIIVIAILVGGFLVFRRLTTQTTTAQDKYQTAPVTRGDIQAMVGATGSVRANQTAVITWQTSGQVKSVNVQVGDPVIADQVLAELDKSSLPQALILAETDLITARRTLDNLINSDTPAAQAYLALVEAQKALQTAQENRTAKGQNRASEANLEAARATYLLAQDKVDRMQDAYDQVANRAEDDLQRANAASNLAAAKQARDRALANLNWMLGTPDVQEIDESDAQVKLAEARLKDAQRDWERLKDGAPADDITAAQARITAIEAGLKAINVRAPFNATITDSRVIKGDLVNPGSIAFRIDDLSRLLVDVQMPEIDINRIRTGMPARISFDAITDREYTGTVIEVGTVGTNVAGVVNFVVTIELLDADNSVLPGMTAAVNIQVNEVKDVIMIPNRAVRLRNGVRVVYIMKDGIPTPVEITAGASSDTYSEVLTGDIRVDDLVVLNPPAETISMSGQPFPGGR
ncbi:MAG TPA: efflux RND transporter periplasmic adaptor subunit [Anaerolineaceae bacterium]|nr:efflux RND transporter periplasmic adaptor subunit [Anaerolineaceae bacterium]